ncbi:hypothetical protein Golob_007060 [Gossypium lobatum]|uniref:RNase H type-1 domain-containing protein n=1 Tax=Gossypium lobatum TaxID=34289 RepID=A0A7J8MB62_9ROSI|nr:hypothetical protein [Gossypium lobatum]
MMRILDKKVIADLMTTLWNSWNNRNNFIFRGNEDEAQIDRVGYGVIARDDEGFMLGSGGGFIKKTMSVEEAECHAFEANIKMACQLNINGDVLFESGK